MLYPEAKKILWFSQKKGKRGYFNRFTGEVVVPVKYDAAWVFSNGIAAVVERDSVHFINSEGTPAINKSFPCDYSLDYVFHGDFCPMSDGQGGVGLIDKSGSWVVKPEYDAAIPTIHNYWKMRKGSEETGLLYAYTDKAELINTEGVELIEMSNDLGVILTLPNHLKMVVDFDGNRQEIFLCHDIEPMYYKSDKRDTDGNLIEEQATLYRYRMSDGYEGLCKANGDMVTEPLYWTVKAIGKDLYHCTYNDAYSGVIINTQGEITGL